MSVKTLMATVPGLSYGKGIGMTDGLRIDSVIAAANDLDRWYVPPAFKVPYHSNNNGAAVRICDLQGTYGVAPVGAATGADTYALNRITVGGSVILIATITMTSLKASAATSLVKGGVGVALLPGEYLRLDCTAIATYATTQPLYFRLQFSYVNFGIAG